MWVEPGDVTQTREQCRAPSHLVGLGGAGGDELGDPGSLGVAEVDEGRAEVAILISAGVGAVSRTGRSRTAATVS